MRFRDHDVGVDDHLAAAAQADAVHRADDGFLAAAPGEGTEAGGGHGALLGGGGGGAGVLWLLGGRCIVGVMPLLQICAGAEGSPFTCEDGAPEGGLGIVPPVERVEFIVALGVDAIQVLGPVQLDL